MSLYELDLTVEKPELELFLAKPNKKVIAKLKEAYDKSITVKLGNVNELNFSIPYEVTKDKELIRNPHVDMIRDRYLIKAKLGEQEEWYIITNINDSMSETEDSKPVTAFLLPYEMSTKLVSIYQEEALNLRQVLMGGVATDINGHERQIEGILTRTRWKLGYVDAEFLTKYRGFDFSSITVLDAVFQVAETFKALIVWDTHKREISFWNPDNYGKNRGLTFNYGHYLKTLNRESNSDEMTTRFKVFGKDGMSIQRVNLTGQNYLEDYSFFLYPFRRNDAGNVIEHSYYMSDELCIAVLDYQNFIKSKSGTFKSYTKELESHQRIKTEKSNELATLEEALAVAKNKLDLENSKPQQDPAAIAAAIADKDAKQAAVNAKKAEIAVVDGNIATVQKKINDLRKSMQQDKFFTPELIDELNDFIIEKEWSDDTYFDDQDLYDEAVKEFEKVKMPSVVISIDVVNFLDVVDCQRDWNKLNIGDTINIRYDKMNINATAKIVEYSIDDEGGGITLTIANTKDILTDEEKFIQMLYQANGTSATIDTNKNKWNQIDATKSQVNEIINNSWDSVKQSIQGGINNTVEISERGVLVRRSDEPNKYIVLQNGVIGLTKDGGNTWKTAITPEYIVAEQVMGKLIAGVNLQIDASDNKGRKTFTVDATGVTISGTALKITNGGLGKDQLNPEFADSLVNLGKNYNGVVIDAANGLVMIDSNKRVRAALNATEGLKFQKNVGSVSSPSWEDRLAYDVATGNFFMDGEIRCRSLKIGGKEVLIGNLIDGDAIGNVKVDKLVAGSAKISTALIEDLEVGGNVKMGANATISWSQVSGQPYIPTLPSYIQQTKIGSTYIESPTISAGSISGASIYGGTITSDTTINVGTNLVVGNNIQIGALGSSDQKTIRFTGSSGLFCTNDSMMFSSNVLTLQCSYLNFSVTHGISGLPPATFG